MEARPFLMFEGQAEAAMTLYTSIFPDGKVLQVERYAAGQPGPEGTIKVARFSVAGLTLACSDSFVQHGFTFTPSVSIFVDFNDEDVLRRVYDQLSDNGQTHMPLADYGFSRLFAWVQDRFGVSWQLNLL
ncbi:MAG TPA: VOC family protein [Candidatus Xenobia bacterium]|jgi:predicted 3-demethylubiquinone-9 3-methyltransferase (glyoxalase superfamily)